MSKNQRAAAAPEAPEVQALPMRYDVKINSIRPEGHLLATASVSLNGCFAIRGVKIMDGEKGPFVSMPRYQAGGSYHDICFPCTKEAHAEFTSAVLGAYDQALAQSQSRTQTRQAAPAEGPSYSGGPEMAM